MPYTKGISGTLLHEALHEIGTTPERRLVSLRRLLVAKPLLKICEVHSALTGSIVENTKVTTDLPNEFDGMWASSLTDSTMRAMPDIEAVDISSRLRLIDEIFEVTTKPLIFDGDTGGIPEHFKFTVRQLERLGVSAVIIEDKTGLKKILSSEMKFHRHRILLIISAKNTGWKTISNHRRFYDHCKN